MTTTLKSRTSIPLFFAILVILIFPTSSLSIINAKTLVPLKSANSKSGTHNDVGISVSNISSSKYSELRKEMVSALPKTKTSIFTGQDPFVSGVEKIKALDAASDSFVDTDPEKSGNEPSIAAHPTNPNIVLAFHRSLIDLLDVTLNRTCDFHRSTDGGKTWSPPVHSPLPPGDSECSDPLIRWAPADGADSDKNVRVYASYLAKRPNDITQDVVVSHSDDNGITWSNPVIVIEVTPEVNIPDKPWIATDDNFPGKKNSKDNDKVYIVSMIFYGEEPEGPDTNPKGNCQVVFSKSIDGGETFPDPLRPKVLAESQDCTPRMEGPIVIGGPHNSLLTCWYHSDIPTFPDTFDIRCRSSKDGGKSFSNEISAVKDKGELPFFKCPNQSYHRLIGAMLPSMEITPDGVAHMVYSADPTPGDSDGECGDVFYAKSPYPWNKWTPTSDQQRINDDKTNTFQGYATITSKKVGQDYVLVTAWEDDRNSIVAGEPNLIYDIYSTTINKDGVISPNSRVSDASSISDFSFIGDYFDISVHRITK